MALPEAFCRLNDVDDTIVACLRYLGCENFTGRPVPGYKDNVVIVTRECAARLRSVQAALREQGLCLVVYDAYRPHKAVMAFVDWSKDYAELSMAEKYYPTFASRKPVLFEKSYISATSNHCRGSTVDVTVVEWERRNSVRWDRTIELQHRRLGDVDVPYLDDGTVDMGSSFDLLDEASHPDAPLEVIPQPYRSRRDLLRRLMEAHGFVVSDREWWHYWLRDHEPFPRPPDGSVPAVFDFDVE